MIKFDLEDIPDGRTDEEIAALFEFPEFNTVEPALEVITFDQGTQTDDLEAAAKYKAESEAVKEELRMCEEELVRYLAARAEAPLQRCPFLPDFEEESSAQKKFSTWSEALFVMVPLVIAAISLPALF